MSKVGKMHKALHNKIDAIRSLAAGSKFSRLLAHPYRYIHAILFREFTYKRNKKEKEISCKTFFGQDMCLLLPCSTDIYLTGGKSDESEIRLAKFLVNNLSLDDTFVDVGAHYGYFTLLGAHLVGKSGKVFSYEAAPRTYKILKKNIKDIVNATGNNLAVSDMEGFVSFYEFPTLYSEYNTLKVKQFEKEKWFEEQKPQEVKVKTIKLDDHLSDLTQPISIIKIDVEGAEHEVLKGFQQYLQKKSPIVVMEYLSSDRESTAHVAAEALMHSLGYLSHAITESGDLLIIESAADHISQRDLDSDNIVFVKA